MSTTNERRNHHRTIFDVNKVTAALGKNRLLWIAPTLAFSLAGVIHSLTKTDQWKASQALIVRDEAIGEMGFSNGTPLGRFESNDSLKRSLETILQITKNQTVAGAALAQVGPEPTSKRKEGQTFPTEKEIEDFIDDISVTAPKGTEFGTSEVIYLSVTASSSPRAIALATTTCDQLENRMQKLRNQHAQSIIAELQEKKALADRELASATAELAALESELGADLGEMRTLAEAGSAGDSNLRTQLNQIKDELRQAEAAADLQRSLLALLRRIDSDTEAILAAPNQLLESQPALRRLKDGLVDAQLRTARLKGGLTEDHPRVQAAMENEQNVERQLVEEIKRGVVSIDAEIGVSESVTGSLREKLSQVQQRLDSLASQRAGYVNLASKVSQRREQLRIASVALAEAEGRLEAAETSSLITRLDTPVTGSRPVGLGNATVILGSLAGGLLLGLSLVYLVAPWQEARGGRRNSDHPRRRAADSVEANDRRSDQRDGPRSTAEPSLEVQSLSDAFQSLPEDPSDPETSLEHLTQIVRPK